MAPRKEKSPAATATATVTAASSPRKTRSMTSGKRVAPPPAALPRPKKAKPAAEEVKKAKEPAAAKGRGKASGGAKAAAGDANDGPLTKSDGKALPSNTIIVEACKQCTSFKKRAEMVKSGVEGAVTGITVEINPDKPRRGCFEIRESNGHVFVSLLNMPRPFTPMKELDMDKVVKDIIKKLG